MTVHKCDKDTAINAIEKLYKENYKENGNKVTREINKLRHRVSVIPDSIKHILEKVLNEKFVSGETYTSEEIETLTRQAMSIVNSKLENYKLVFEMFYEKERTSILVNNKKINVYKVTKLS